MSYEIRYYDADGLTGSEHNITRLEQAQSLAEAAVADGAKCAEVLDANGDVVFRRPRMLRKA